MESKNNNLGNRESSSPVLGTFAPAPVSIDRVLVNLRCKQEIQAQINQARRNHDPISAFVLEVELGNY